MKLIKSKLKDLNYTNENILNPNDIKIYNFKKQAEYLFKAKCLDINETGFVDKNFSQITDELYNESFEIIDSMRS